MEAEQFCPSPFGEIELRREIVDRTGTLRAWDGADLLLLDHVHALGLAPTTRVLIMNDSFGALSISLRDFDPFVLSDSVSADEAVAANAGRNRVVHDFRFVPSTTPDLAAALGGPVDVVVWNVPRSTDLIAYGASQLSSVSHPGTVVLAAGMDKHLPPRTGEILRSIGEVTTHPGRRKAHVFEVRVPQGLSSYFSIPAPARASVNVAEHGLVLEGGPGVFSADRLDLGARLLAGQIPVRSEAFGVAREVVDLGCGNGVLGILALREFPESTVHFLDDSRHAIDAAQRNVRANTTPDETARAAFTASNIFGPEWSVPVDLVLCNPPFHHTNAMSDEIAWQMFVQSHRYLAPGGELWVVANRHLAYHAKLTRIFGNVRQLDSHPKFVVLASTR